MQVRWLLVGVALALASGCGGQRFAPVAGRITLNGKPLANAQIVFNMIPREGSIESAPSAVGTTNQNGEYTLRVSQTQTGAPVGKHRVAISAMSTQANPDSDAPVAPGAAPRNIVPSRYNDKTELICEVSASGNDHADFELKAR